MSYVVIIYGQNIPGVSAHNKSTTPCINKDKSNQINLPEMNIQSSPLSQNKDKTT